MLLDRGIEFTRQPNGALIITKVPVREQTIMKFFTGAPCFFPGCEELRAAFKGEEQKLAQDCPACERGALINKYRDKVAELLPK